MGEARGGGAAPADGGAAAGLLWRRAHRPGDASRYPLKQGHHDRRAAGEQPQGPQAMPLRVLAPGFEVTLQPFLQPAENSVPQKRQIVI